MKNTNRQEHCGKSRARAGSYFFILVGKSLLRSEKRHGVFPRGAILSRPLPHNHDNGYDLFRFFIRNQGSFSEAFSIYDQFLYPFFHTIRIFHLDVVFHITILSDNMEAAKVFRNTGVDAKTL